MWTDMEKDKVLQSLDHIEKCINDLDEAVFGDNRQGRDGLVRDMKVVHAHIIKVDKWEHTAKWFAAALGSNLLVSIIILVLNFVAGG